ncbi:hypothetical protein [Schaalia suimastitidis]|uniref:hypothetical protein n=1 Tax=Schaalia suimastitidis TaxID=121163 RepID=UPI000416EA3C|nr:hypothetical protein [Schaalia suimastitidis]
MNDVERATQALTDFAENARVSHWAENEDLKHSGYVNTSTYGVPVWLSTMLSPLLELVERLDFDRASVDATIFAWRRFAQELEENAADIRTCVGVLDGEQAMTLTAFRSRTKELSSLLTAHAQAAYGVSVILEKQANIAQGLHSNAKAAVDDALVHFTPLISSGNTVPTVGELAQVTSWVSAKTTHIHTLIENAAAAFSSSAYVISMYGAAIAGLGGTRIAGRALLADAWRRDSLGGARDGRKGAGEPQGEGETDSTGAPFGLGEPVAGEDAPIPKITPWKYGGDTPEDGSGPHGQYSPTIDDLLVHEVASQAANGLKAVWPDASKNLTHFLGNSGKPLDANVDRLLTEVPSLQGKVDVRLNAVAADAVKAAQNAGASGPVTYPFTTDWQSHYAQKSESENWYYATGGFQYAVAGTVTVYPPSSPNGEWSSRYDYQVHMADRYNWDGNKGVTIGPVAVSDAQLQELHRAGIAQEYDLSGVSTVRSGP